MIVLEIRHEIRQFEYRMFLLNITYRVKYIVNKQIDIIDEKRM